MRRRGAGGSLPHDLSVEVDPAGLTARFADDVTFVSAGAGDLYVLLGADALLERVSGPEGQDVAFSRAYGWLSLPFAVYRIASPGIERGREFSLRFEWHVTPGTVRFVNPFVALHFFHLGFDALWYPHMPGEETSASLLYAKAYRPYVEGARGRPRALSAVELFDDDRDVLYQKGTLVFRMLHRRLGDEAFFALIRSFIHHHAGRVVTGQEFIDFADAFVREAGAAGAAGVHEPAGLRAFFDQWIQGTQTLDYALQVLEAGEAHLAFRVVSRGRLVEPGQVPVEVQLANAPPVRTVPLPLPPPDIPSGGHSAVLRSSCSFSLLPPRQFPS